MSGVIRIGILITYFWKYVIFGYIIFFKKIVLIALFDCIIFSLFVPFIFNVSFFFHFLHVIDPNIFGFEK